MRILNNKAVSTVFGSIIFIILSVVVISALLLTFYQYDQLSSQALGTEKSRLEEKLVLVKLETEMNEGTEYLTRVLVNNEGTITSKICAVYVDEKFIFDPSDDTTINPISYINAHTTLWLYVPLAKIPYQEESFLKITTELGSIAIEQEGTLKNPPKPPNPANIPVFGPLQLDFEYFYYTECDSAGNFNADSWKDGSSIDIGARPIVWKIAVTNVCNKDITLSKFSCLTTMPNDMSIKQRPWYIEPTKTEGGSADGIRIESKEKLSLVYIWDSSAGTTPQTIYDIELQAKILMTFFGTFHEKDGSTKPYGQTIPFQAINMRQPRLEIEAATTAIAAGSTTQSTITVTTRTLYGDPAPNQQVSLSTNHGNLGSNMVTTNIQGIATTTFNAQQETFPNTATITASWNNLTQSATVSIGLGSLTISTNPTTIVLGSTSTVVATLTYGGAPLSGQGVVFSTNIGTLPSSPITTNSLGQATVTFTGSASGDATITATALAGTAMASTHVHTITGISVNPPSAIKTAGETQQYTARTIPGNWDITPAIFWSITPQAGGSWDQSTATYTTNKAGIWTVTATFGTISGSSSLTVNPAAVASLVVSGFPSAATAGVAHDVTVTALDSYGNIATGFNGKIHFTSSDSQANLPDDYQFMSGDSGVHTFINGITLRTAGIQSFTATDTNTNSITGSQIGITVNPALLNHFDFAAITHQTAGIAYSITITAKDAYGNTVVSYAGNPDLTSNSWTSVQNLGSFNSGTLTGSVTSSIAISLSTITATDGTITGTSNTFTVNSGTLSTIVVSPNTASIPAGSTQAFTAEAFDAYGNSLGHVTSSTVWSIDVGAGGSWVQSTGTYTSEFAGTWTVTGIYSGVSDIVSLTVVPDDVSYFAVYGFSDPSVAGVAHDILVTAKDTFGNTATGYSGIVKISSSDGSAILPASAGLTNGVGTFTVTLKTVGEHSITATDSIIPSVTGTQGSITVNPAGASSFVVSGFPSPVTAGVAGTVTVEALDAHGNRATDYSGTVVITCTDGSAILPAAGSLTAGVGTFEVTLKTVGAQSITATDSTTSTIMGAQSLIEVNAGPLNSITINPTNSSIITGGSESYLIEAFDAYGNSLGDVTLFATFTLDGSAIANNIVSSSVVGDHIVEASYEGKTASAILTVASGGG